MNYRKKQSPGGVLQKTGVLKISPNSQENICFKVYFLINFIKIETLTQVFSCEFSEIFKNTLFIEHLFK